VVLVTATAREEWQVMRVSRPCYACRSTSVDVAGTLIYRPFISRRQNVGDKILLATSGESRPASDGQPITASVKKVSHAHPPIARARQQRDVF